MKSENQMVARTQNGQHTLPASISRKLERISYDHYRAMRIRSIQNLLNHQSDVVRISTIMKYHDYPEKIISGMVVKFLEQVRQVTGVNNFMGSEGARYFVEYIMEEHGNMTMADIQIFCHRIMRGDYGHSYENIPAQKIIIWFREYVDHRAHEIYRIKRLQDAKREKEIDGNIDRKGLLRIADKFGEIHQRSVKDRKEKYKDLWDYIDRNGLDEDKFVNDFVDRHSRIFLAKGYERDKLESPLFERVLMNEMKMFVEHENAKISADNKGAI